MNNLVEREYDYIKGSTAVKPSRKSIVTTPRRSKYNLRKVKKNANKKLKNQSIETRKNVLMTSVMIFCLGVMVITGDAKVYNIQQKVTEVDSQIKIAQETNEALKVKLLKFSSLQNIKNISESHLAMVVPNKSDIVKIDFSENYFANLENTNDEENKTKKGLFSKLKDAFK
ncbi:FtsB/FtsL family cell division protein [Clostridium sp. CTA-5]